MREVITLEEAYARFADAWASYRYTEALRLARLIEKFEGRGETR